MTSKEFSQTVGIYYTVYTTIDFQEKERFNRI